MGKIHYHPAIHQINVYQIQSGTHQHNDL